MKEDKSQKTIIIATVSFIVGFALAWFIVGNQAQTPNEQKDGDTEVGEAVTGGDFILASDQTEGVRVILDKVSLKEGGWAVIHENSEGTPGRILGAQLFDAGEYTNAAVELLRGTLAGGTYYAMLHSDNGDRSFDPKKDWAVTDEEGNPILSEFQVLPAVPEAQ